MFALCEAGSIVAGTVVGRPESCLKSRSDLPALRTIPLGRLSPRLRGPSAVRVCRACRPRVGQCIRPRRGYRPGLAVATRLSGTCKQLGESVAYGSGREADRAQQPQTASPQRVLTHVGVAAVTLDVLLTSCPLFCRLRRRRRSSVGGGPAWIVCKRYWRGLNR